MRPQFPHQSGGLAIGPRLTRIVKILIIANVAAYVLQAIFVHWVAPAIAPDRIPPGPGGVVQAMLLLPFPLVPAAVLSGQIWRLITYLFLHDPLSPGHLLLNMVGLWMFGSTMEQRWGAKNFLLFYLGCGVGGGVAVTLWALLFPATMQTPTIGASGAVLGVVAAFGILYAERKVYFFGILPLAAKYLALGALGLTLLSFLAQTSVSFAAHIGGMATGALWVTGLWRPRRLMDNAKRILARRRGRRKKKPKWPVLPGQKKPNRQDNDWIN